MKLLATDFDVTLFDKNNFNKNIEYVNKFVDEGNVFAIVTGRYLDNLLDDIKKYDLHYSYLICNDGGIIFDKDLNVLYRKDIPQAISIKIADIYKDSSCLFYWYNDTGIGVTKDKNKISNGLIGKFNDRIKAQRLLDDIKSQYNEIGGYLSNTWINITEKSVNKGYGIKILADVLNINGKNVYTIGDNINDISMSNYNFNCYCMKNSIPELKNVTIKSYNAVYELIKDILKENDN
jgi:HAD superfamily hydrolase (TIGR01484 family)